MSHFTEMKTKLKELDRVIQVAKKRGYEVIEAKSQEVLQAQGFMEDKIDALAVIKTSTRYEIAVTRDDEGNLQFTADWNLIEKTSDLREEGFVQEICQNYALSTIEEMAERNGFTMGELEVAEDGSIEVDVSQW